MTLLAATAPLVTIAHDWTSPVERVRTIPSSVLARHDGSSQRLPLSNRATDRLTYRLIALSASDATQLAALLQQATDGIVRMPRWEDQTRLPAAVSAGDDVVTVDTTGRPTFVAGAQVLFRRSASEFEVGVLEAVTDSTITLVDPLTSAWKRGTIVVPITAARLVLPVTLTQWTPTTGALTFAIETTLTDLAGVGTGGGAATGVPTAVSLGVVDLVNGGLPRTSRAAVVARVTDAAGTELPGDGIVWSTSDATIAPVYATMDPRIALVRNARPDSSLGSSTNRTITATLGALVASIVISLYW